MGEYIQPNRIFLDDSPTIGAFVIDAPLYGLDNRLIIGNGYDDGFDRNPERLLGQDPIPNKTKVIGGNFWNSFNTTEGKVNSTFEHGSIYGVVDITLMGEYVGSNRIWLKIVDNDGNEAWISSVNVEFSDFEYSFDDMLDFMLLMKYQQMYETDPPSDRSTNINTVSTLLSQATGGGLISNPNLVDPRELRIIGDVAAEKNNNLQYLNQFFLNNEAEIVTLTIEDSSINQSLRIKKVSVLVGNGKFYWPISNGELTSRSDQFAGVTGLYEVKVPDGLNVQLSLSNYGDISFELMFNNKAIAMFDPNLKNWNLIESSTPPWLEQLLENDPVLWEKIRNNEINIESLIPESERPYEEVVFELTENEVDELMSGVGAISFTTSKMTQGASVQYHRAENLTPVKVVEKFTDGLSFFEVTLAYKLPNTDQIQHMIIYTPISIYITNTTRIQMHDQSSWSRIYKKIVTANYTFVDPNQTEDYYKRFCELAAGSGLPNYDIDNCYLVLKEKIEDPSVNQQITEGILRIPEMGNKRVNGFWVVDFYNFGR